MRLLALISALVVSTCAFADTIDLGQASQYNAFIKENYRVTSSDVEGKVAVGGNLYVNGGYDIGTHVLDHGMSSGPSLVVGGDINKTGSGNFNVYQSQSQIVAGDVVLGGELTGGPNGTGQVTQNSTTLPVNFDSAFSHLESLSANLAARTEHNAVTDHGWALEFTVNPDVVPTDGVYVFNVTQDMFASTWLINTDGMADNSTFIFNVSNTESTSVNFTQSRVFLTNNNNRFDYSNPIDGYFRGKNDYDKPPVQLLYNFADANRLHLNSDLYGTVLAPNADIIANSSVIWGQVIGKSWQGNMQINYNPFDPVDGGTTKVPEAPTVFLFVMAIVIIAMRKFKLPSFKVNKQEQFAI